MQFHHRIGVTEWDPSEDYGPYVQTGCKNAVCRQCTNCISVAELCSIGARPCTVSAQPARGGLWAPCACMQYSCTQSVCSLCTNCAQSVSWTMQFCTVMMHADPIWTNSLIIRGMTESQSVHRLRAPFAPCDPLLSWSKRGLWAPNPRASSCNVPRSGTCAQCVAGWMHRFAAQTELCTPIEHRLATARPNCVHP